MWDECKPITWAYLAGFTDGEGYIGIVNNSPRITLYQNADASWVLCEIEDFLREHEIHCSIYPVSRKIDRRHPNPGMYLHVRRVRSVYEYLRSTQPYLIVKLEAARTVLKFIERKRKAALAATDGRAKKAYYQGWGE